MLDYLQRMLDLALRKELQGIHFWATLYASHYTQVPAALNSLA